MLTSAYCYCLPFITITNSCEWIINNRRPPMNIMIIDKKVNVKALYKCSFNKTSEKRVKLPCAHLFTYNFARGFEAVPWNSIERIHLTHTAVHVWSVMWILVVPRTWYKIGARILQVFDLNSFFNTKLYDDFQFSMIKLSYHFSRQNYPRLFFYVGHHHGK